MAGFTFSLKTTLLCYPSLVFLCSVPRDHHSQLSLPCNEHICLSRTGRGRTVKGEHPCAAKSHCKSDYKTKLGMICWEAKLQWKGRHGVQGDTWLLALGQDWSPKPFPCRLPAFLASWIDLQHYYFLVL